MNAPSRIVSSPVETFLPGCAGEELKLRERLVKARELTTSRLPFLKSDNARALSWIILETVTVWVYAPASTDDLRDVANHCLRLFMCADFAEQMERTNG
jgi:hypothetical protein